MAPAGQANWPGNPWGTVIADVRTITVHVTAGWPRRERVEEFVRQYITNVPNNRGIGPQCHISGDGTVFRIVELPRLTWHAEWTNGWSVGVETGNPADSSEIPPPPGNANWIAVTNAATDLPGLKLYLTPRDAVHAEVVPFWFTLNAYTGGARRPLARSMPLFPEQQMQAWALLARYLTAELGVPRNFPLLPHLSRSDMIDGPNAPTFRRIVLADESAEMTQRRLAAAPISIPAAAFDLANAADLEARYGDTTGADRVIVPANPRSSAATSQSRVSILDDTLPRVGLASHRRFDGLQTAAQC